MKVYLFTTRHSTQFEKTGEHGVIHSLASALRALGCEVDIYCSDQSLNFPEPKSVCVHVGGGLFRLVEGVPNVLWLLSNPTFLPISAAVQYQTIFTSSQLHFNLLQKKGIRNLAVLPQCTDTKIFHPPAPHTERTISYFFAGNRSAKHRGNLVERAFFAGVDIEIMGLYWGRYSKSGKKLVRRDNRQLAEKYRQTQIGLNVHRNPAGRLGFANNRNYELLACGARVVADQNVVPEALKKFVTVPPKFKFNSELKVYLNNLPAFTSSEREEAFDIIKREFSVTAAATKILRACETLQSTNKVWISPFSKLSPLKNCVRSKQAIPKFIVCDDPSLYKELRESIPSKYWQDSGFELLRVMDLKEAIKRRKNAEVHVILAPSNRWFRHHHPSEYSEVVQTANRLTRLMIINRHASGSMVCTALDDEYTDKRDEAFHITRAREICSRWERAPIGKYTYDTRLLKDFLMGRTKLNMANGKSFTTLITYLNGADPTSTVDPKIKQGFNLLEDTPYRVNWARQEVDKFLREKNKLSQKHVRHTSIPKIGLHGIVAPEGSSEKMSLDRPIGVFLHCYYLDTVKALREAIDKINAPIKIYASTNESAKIVSIKREFDRYVSDRDFEIKITENRGRDVYPKLFCWKEEHSRHDVVLHLHGKRSEHQKSEVNWGNHMLNALLPDTKRVHSILSMFREDKTLGMFGTRPVPSIVTSLNWTSNTDYGREICHRTGWKIERILGHKPIFPAGSMFWARSAAIKPLLDLDLDFTDFPLEAGQLDGTIAHAIERCFALSAIDSGYKYAQLASRDSIQSPAANKYLKQPSDLKEFEAEINRFNNNF